MKTKNQRGFTAVEGLLIVLVIVVLGGAGFYVWNKNVNNKPAASTSSTTKTQSSTSPSPSPSQTSATSQKYLTIAAWGVRAPYSGSDTLSYSFKDQNLDKNSSSYGSSTYSTTKVTDTAIVISKIMSDKYGCTGTNELPSGAGVLSRNLATSVYNTQPPTDKTYTYAQMAKSDPTQFKQIGKYVYAHGDDQASCSQKTDVGSVGYKDAGIARSLGDSLIPKLEAIR